MISRELRIQFFKLLIAMALVFTSTPRSFAGPGTIPFVIFKSVAALAYGSIGGYSQVSGYVTGQTFYPGDEDGAYYPSDQVAVDTTNNILYIASSSRLVKINSLTGIHIGSLGYSTASTGTCPSGAVATGWCTGGTMTGWFSDGSYQAPAGVAVDVAGDILYVADTQNHRIVKLTASTGAFIGAIGRTSSTTGTCPASGAAATWCTGGAFLSGTGNGMFDNPMGLAIDPAANALYIADKSRIVKITASTGAFIGAIGYVSSSTGTCVPTAGGSPGAAAWCTGGVFAASTNDASYNRPSGLALDTTNKWLYIADSSNYSVSKVNATTGAWNGAIGHVQSNNASPTCPASGPAPGWCTGGVFSYQGSGNGSLSNVHSVAVDPAANVLYISDDGAYRLTKVTASTGAYVGSVGHSAGTTGTCPASAPATGWCTGGSFVNSSSDGGFNSPRGLAVDPVNNKLFVANAGNYSITKMIASTGAFEGSTGMYALPTTTWTNGLTFKPGGTDGMYSSPNGMAMDTTNNILYVAVTGASRITKINAATGVTIGSIGRLFSTTGTCPASGAATGWCTGGTFYAGQNDGMFSSPRGIEIDVPGGFLYVADTGNHRIVKINLTTGAFIGAIGYPFSSSGTCVGGTTAAGWCTGGIFSTGAANGRFASPRGLAIDTGGNFLYVADTGNHRISKITLSTGAYVGSVGRTSATTGTCPAAGTAASWCTGGTFTTNTADGGYNNPADVAVNPGGSWLYVADRGNFRISRLTLGTGAANGSIGRTSATGGTCPASGPATVWCTGGTFVTSAADGGFSGIYHLNLDIAANYLYASDDASSRLIKINLGTGAFFGSVGRTTATSGTCPASGAATTWCTGGTFTAGTGDNMYSTPQGIAIDPGRNLIYNGDGTNYRIQKRAK